MSDPVNTPTFIGGPFDPKNPPKKFVQVFATDGVDTRNKGDQVDRTIQQGTYTKVSETTEGPVYEWKGVKP